MLYRVRSVGQALLNALLPHRCLRCGTTVGSAPGLCAECYPLIRFVAGEGCHCCGAPVSAPGLLCGACLAHPPAYDGARSALLYDRNSRDLVLRFKHADATHMAPVLAAWLHRAGRDILEGADALVPVPLHWRRLFSRRYNQSALLARQVSRRTGIPCEMGLLHRVLNTQPQGYMRRNARQENVRRAFVVRAPGRVLGKKLVLIDDVLTTGATVTACARALKQAGAASVTVLTVARVLRE